MSRVHELLGWAKKILGYDSKTREEIRDEVLESLKQVSMNGEGQPDKRAGMKLFQALTDKSNFSIIGFCPNLEYIKIKAPDEEDLLARWIHAFGTETLVCVHKKLPVIMLVNPGIRLNKTVLSEMQISREDVQIDGISS